MQQALEKIKKNKKKKNKKKNKRNGSKDKPWDPFHAFRRLPVSLFSKNPAERDQRQILISPRTFTQKDGILKWYWMLGSKKIRRIEIRKDLSAMTFRHEFAVAYLTDRTMYRFDRRPHKEPSTLVGDLVKGCKAEDTITPVTTSELEKLRETSNIIGKPVNFKPGLMPDMILIISFTLHLSSNSKTKKYEIGRYNCYFFARSIVKFISSIKPKHLSNYVRSRYMDLMKSAVNSTVKFMLKNAYATQGL